MAELNRRKEHLGMMGVTKTYEGKTSSTSTMQANNENDDGFLAWGTGLQMAQWDSEKYRRLIKRFAELDGQEINLENQRRFLEMMWDCDLLPGTEREVLNDEETVRDKWNTYQTIINAYGFGQFRNRDRFVLTDIARVVVNDDDIDFFIMDQMLKFQYPNGVFPKQERQESTGAMNYKMKPFVFFLRLLTRLYDKEPENAFLSRDEIYAIRRTRSHEWNDVDAAVAQINHFRNNDAPEPTDPESPCAKTITRFFPAFGAAKLLTYNKGDNARIISIDEAQRRDIQEVFDFSREEEA